MKRMLALLFLFLFLSACAPAPDEPASDGEYGLWFAVSQDSSRSRSSAVAKEKRDWGEGGPSARELIEALLDGPKTDGLFAPFPKGVTIRSFTVDTEHAAAQVDLTEQYGGLAGFDLTLADCCIVLTLCQLPEIQAVEILVEGEPIPYRDRQELRLEDILLPGVLE